MSIVHVVIAIFVVRRASRLLSCYQLLLANHDTTIVVAKWPITVLVQAG